MDHAHAYESAARARATMYPAYDPAAAVRAYVDEFGALALAGWVALGIALAVAARRAPADATPLASFGYPIESGVLPGTIVTRP